MNIKNSHRRIQQGAGLRSKSLALIAIAGGALITASSSFGSFHAYICTHNGEPYAVVSEGQQCPAYVHTEADKHSPGDPDCIIRRGPGWE